MKKIILGSILLFNTVAFGMVPCSTTLRSEALFEVARLVSNGTLSEQDLQILPEDLRSLIKDILPLYTGRYTKIEQSNLHSRVEQLFNRLPSMLKTSLNYVFCFLLQPPASMNEFLLYAISKDNPSLVRAALGKGADVKYKVPAQVLTTLTQTLLSLLQAKQALPGESSLALAVRLGNANIVQLLLNYPYDPEDYAQALSDAARMGYDYLIPLLLDKGASVEFKDNEGLTPLHNAVLRGYSAPGNSDEVENTLRKLEKQVRSISAKSPNYEGTVELLLQNKADINTRDNIGRTPLINATVENDAPMVKLLLNHKANKSIRDNNGLTALDWAQRLNFEDIAQLLQDR